MLVSTRQHIELPNEYDGFSIEYRVEQRRQFQYGEVLQDPFPVPITPLFANNSRHGSSVTASYYGVAPRRVSSKNLNAGNLNNWDRRRWQQSRFLGGIAR
ncbi:MAG: hypothetical protein ACLU2U_03980 [Bifidobacterium angulatum]